jgi:hypothetical protein
LRLDVGSACAAELSLYTAVLGAAGWPMVVNLVQGVGRPSPVYPNSKPNIVHPVPLKSVVKSQPPLGSVCPSDPRRRPTLPPLLFTRPPTPSHPASAHLASQGVGRPSPDPACAVPAGDGVRPFNGKRGSAISVGGSNTSMRVTNSSFSNHLSTPSEPGPGCMPHMSSSRGHTQHKTHNFVTHYAQGFKSHTHEPS